MTPRGFWPSVGYLYFARSYDPLQTKVFINATTTAGNDQIWSGRQILPTRALLLPMWPLMIWPRSWWRRAKWLWSGITPPSRQPKTLLNVAYRPAGFTPLSITSPGWSLTQIPIPEGTDDHLNLKSLQANGTGQIFAAIKTAAPQSGPLNAAYPNGSD